MYMCIKLKGKYLNDFENRGLDFESELVEYKNICFYNFIEE